MDFAAALKTSSGWSVSEPRTRASRCASARIRSSTSFRATGCGEVSKSGPTRGARLTDILVAAYTVGCRILLSATPTSTAASRVPSAHGSSAVLRRLSHFVACVVNASPCRAGRGLVKYGPSTRNPLTAARDRSSPRARTTHRHALNTRRRKKNEGLFAARSPAWPLKRNWVHRLSTSRRVARSHASSTRLVCAVGFRSRSASRIAASIWWVLVCSNL